MSRATGHVIHDNKVVGYFEYNGSTDVACSDIHPTLEGVRNRLQQAHVGKCECGQPPTPVLLYTSYGFGFHWPSEACLACGVITGELFSEDSVDGHPLGRDFET